MAGHPDSIDRLNTLIRSFADERDWQQFHSPKNLSMALIVEAAELVEHFQWLSQQESLELSSTEQEEVALEMADIFIYLVRMADRLDIDLLRAARSKIAINSQRYPADKASGRADKYTRYQQEES
jgi:NTP pyrophosphatase (non-canonical NTP hydrolase)